MNAWIALPVYAVLVIVLVLVLIAISRLNDIRMQVRSLGIPLAIQFPKCAGCGAQVDEMNSAEFFGPVPVPMTGAPVRVRFRVCHVCIASAA